MPKNSENGTRVSKQRVRIKSDKSDENDFLQPSIRKKLKANEDSSDVHKIHVNKNENRQCNFLNYYKNHEAGFPCQKYKQSIKDLVIKYCQTFQIYKIESPFDRRVTFIVWHPTNPRLLAVTSHWGDVILYDYEKNIDSASLIRGIGAGGSIQGMKFDPLNPVQIYTASMEGKFLVMNFETKQAKQFLETNDFNRWYISVDVNSANNVMVAGDTRGSLSLLTLQGEIILDQVQLHKKGFKISHAEFSKREPWLLCTSSTDSTMKLWDIRKLKPEKSGLAMPLQVIEHEKPINAAYFSLTDGCRLMTTDQRDKIFIYRAPLWELETVISHPHRQFQHLTPIKAFWHPFEDIVFVGRYPHCEFPGYTKDELRTIDFFDADTGVLLYKLYQTGCNGILSLNRFNITGDALASSYGARFIIWKPNFRAMERLSKKQDLVGREGGEPDETDTSEVDWNAFLKKQSKEKSANKSKRKLKLQTEIQMKVKEAKDREKS